MQDQSHLTDNQRYILGCVYDTVARLLPLEGRDFEMIIAFQEGTGTSISVRGLTPLGLAFAEHCKESLQPMLNEVVGERKGELGKAQINAIKQAVGRIGNKRNISVGDQRNPVGELRNRTGATDSASGYAEHGTEQHVM